VALQVIGAPVMVKARQDVCYDSPIDGRPVTSWHARQEDLKRHDCIEYDPEMNKDAVRRRKESEAAFDHSVEETAKTLVAKLPPKKRAALKKEIVNQGATMEVQRHAC